MRYIVAISISVVLILCMFAFANWMAVCEQEWSEQDVDLSAFSLLGIHSANFIWGYWISVVPLLLVIPVSLVMLFRGKKPSLQEELSEDIGEERNEAEVREAPPHYLGLGVRRRDKPFVDAKGGAIQREPTEDEGRLFRRGNRSPRGRGGNWESRK
jgi:hypothetical protein